MTKIRELRIERGIQQKELASKLGVPANTYNQWENGKRDPDYQNLSKIADYFGVSVDYLLGREETKKATDSVGDPNSTQLTNKDELDISKRLGAMLNDLTERGGALMFDGEPLDDESRELLVASIENSMRMAKLIAKQKYTPKKYRKGSADDQ